MRYIFLVLGFLLIASTASARYVSVSWDEVVGATSYTLYWGQTSGIDPTNASSYDYTYEYTVPANYDPLVEYDDNGGGSVGDIVLYNGLVYECIGSNITGIAPDGNFSDNWKLIQGHTATSIKLAIDTATIYMVVTSTVGGTESTASSEITIPSTAGVNGALLQSFDLTSATTGTNPFTVGLVFKKAETINPTLDITDYACDVKRTWNDGSAKHVICSGSVAMTADTPKTINVYSTGTPPTGTTLTEADIVTAAPTATVNLEPYGSVSGISSLAPLLGSPDRVWISNHEMVEAHYSEQITTTLFVKYHVRLYKNGEMRVRAIVENGNYNGALQRIVPDPSIIINGVTIWNNDSASLTIEKHQIYDQYAWIGITDPDITIKHDTEYMMESLLVPKYWKYNPSEDALNGVFQPGGTSNGQKTLIGTYTPLDRASWYSNQSASGFQTNIGWIPWWDALYINSYGDERAYRAVVANARAAGFFPYARNHADTNYPPAFSLYPTITLGGGDYPVTGAGGNGGIFDRAHAPSVGYLAYMITGDYHFLEMMQNSCATTYVTRSSATGTGTSRLWDYRINYPSMTGVGYNLQGRDVAWSMRTFAQLAAIAPMDEQFNVDVRALFKSNVDHFLSRHQSNTNELGIFHHREIVWEDAGRYAVAHWYDEFNIWALAMAYDGEALSDTDQTTLASVLDYKFALPVGMTGGAGSDSYCYQRGMEYRLSIASTQDSDPSNWYDFGQAYSEAYGANTSCPDGLNLPIAEVPYVTQVGSKIAALVMAINHKKPGAVEGYLRLQSAQNWNTLETSGFENIPIWGIYPRVALIPVGQPDPDPEPTPSLRKVRIRSGRLPFTLGVTPITID